jgi:hypothetical protein
MGRFVKNLQLGHTASQSVIVPAGFTSNRPDFPVYGAFRFNISTGYLEYFDGTSFVSLAAGGAIQFVVDSFTGDGSTDTFVLSQTPADDQQLIAFVGAIYQNPATYSVSGSNIIFSSAPPTTETVNVIQASI